MSYRPIEVSSFIDITATHEVLRGFACWEKLGAAAVQAEVLGESPSFELLSQDEPTLDETLDEFDDRAEELFGQVVGYYLLNIEPETVILTTEKNLRRQRAPRDVVHTVLTGKVFDWKLTLRKEHCAGRNRMDLEPTIEDWTILKLALAKLASVNQQLGTPEA